MEPQQLKAWGIRTLTLFICVSAVGLCVVSAVLSILKLIETYNTPASSYVQLTSSGYYPEPGQCSQNGLLISVKNEAPKVTRHIYAAGEFKHSPGRNNGRNFSGISALTAVKISHRSRY